jgi:hypothetical protein
MDAMIILWPVFWLIYEIFHVIGYLGAFLFWPRA